MALFQKKPQITSAAPLYSIGTHKSVLIIGLGNPGKEYAGSRHNIGFEVLDAFAAANDFPPWSAKKDLKCELSLHTLGDTRVVLAKPITFMNSSGEAAQALQQFYKIPSSHTLVVYDELAVPFGTLRTRLGGSDAGHNGVKSLITHIGPDFTRLRVGIGDPATMDPSKYVLAKFRADEKTDLATIIKEAAAMVSEFIFGSELPHDTRKVL